jgi:hypothetical protein
MALAIPSVTAWLTYGRRGTLRMSQPAVMRERLVQIEVPEETP